MREPATPYRPFSGRRASASAAVAAALIAAAGLLLAQQPPETPRIVIDTAVQRFAIPDCVPRLGDDQTRQACRTVTEVLRNDLKFEGLFQFVPESLLRAIPSRADELPNFEDWKGIGAKILVVTKAALEGAELNVELRVYFVDSGQTMLAKRYSGRADNPRVFAHQASDDIMTLTQYRGIARTKLAFVSDRDAARSKPSKEIYIMDYDGFNPRQVTVNSSLNLLPAWSPDGRSLAYVSYRQGAPLLYLAHIYEGRSSANLSGEKGNGQAFAPAFSPDGTKIAYASNRSGNMEIWTANANGTGTRRLTASGALDTAPCWSPTGQEIAFTSNRGGGLPQIWVMDSEGLNVRRLTTVGSYNDACTWNPSKQYSEIAYSSRLEAGGFEIAVIDLASRQVRQVTTGRGSCESPAWAPNGRHLVFACNRGGSWQMTISDRLGSSIQTLPGPGNNVQPDWSP